MSEEVEHISADNLEYHRELLTEFRAARDNLALARDNLEARRNSLDAWSAHLVRRYKLGPQDRIEEDGRIVRASGTD